ncbi:hypothetical protein, partial [Staphylococcus aureus]|uniref:hypothetical protein n=1 Tax=Staphylococcus aureus TaxID=1280 RepID=UPI0038B34796
MKIAVVLCALVATIFTQTDGKALGRAEVSDVEEVFSLVEERVKGLAELQFEAEQLQKINDQVKKTG